MEEYLKLSCVNKKIDNRRARKLTRLDNLEVVKSFDEVESKNIPKDRRYERLQIANRLWKKLEARYIKKLMI